MTCSLFLTSTERLLIFSSPKIEELAILVDLRLSVSSMQMRHRRQWIGWMEEKLTDEKLQFSLQNMGPMLKGFIEEGSLRSLPGKEECQEAVVLGQVRDIVLIIGTGITEGEVGAGIGTMAGNEVTTIKAGVVAILQNMTEVVVELGVVMMMMMSVGARVLLKVLILEGAYRLAGPLLRAQVLIIAARHQMVTILILGALHKNLDKNRSDCSSHELEF